MQLFLEDYLCAVQKKTLKQGRMYIFDKHIGFHANIFGHHKYYSIPIKVRAAPQGIGEERRLVQEDVILFILY